MLIHVNRNRKHDRYASNGSNNRVTLRKSVIRNTYIGAYVYTSANPRTGGRPKGDKIGSIELVIIKGGGCQQFLMNGEWLKKKKNEKNT